jgi:hypothetical protein
MKTNISIDPKTLDARIEFKFDDLNGPVDFKNSIAIISMIAGDFSLDPELELEDLNDLVVQGKEAGNTAIVFDIGEDGIEAEFTK